MNSSWISRIHYYLNETFPIGSRLLLSFLMIVMFSLKTCLVFGQKLNWIEIIIGTISLWCMLLYYRLCDEFKDKDTDAIIFPNRPVPSGKVLLKDLDKLIYIICILPFVLNLYIPNALPTLFLLFVFLFLMGRWFFMTNLIGNNRILAFVTHSPSAYFYNLYSISINSSLKIEELFISSLQSYIIWLALPGLLWEILRKTYAPIEEKTGYQTYSSMLTQKGALFLSLIILIIFQLMGIYYVTFFNLWIKNTFYVLNIIFALSIFIYLLKPQILSNKKRMVGEIFCALVYILAISDSLIGYIQ